MNKNLEQVISFLKSKSIFLIYCPNSHLGTHGPFVPLDSLDEIEEIINMKNKEEMSEQELLAKGFEEIFISGD